MSRADMSIWNGNAGLQGFFTPVSISAMAEMDNVGVWSLSQIEEGTWGLVSNRVAMTTRHARSVRRRRRLGRSRPLRWRVSDRLWEQLAPLLPDPPRRFRHPGRRRYPARACLEGIL
jgi:hypothetical protein